MRDVAFHAMRFGAVGLVNTVIGLGIIWLAMALGVSTLPANAIGYAFGLVVSFVLNRAWTFRWHHDGTSPGAVIADARRFAGAFAVAWLMNIAVVWSGLQVSDISPFLLQVAGVVTYSTVFFVLCRLWVFAVPRSLDSKTLARDPTR